MKYCVFSKIIAELNLEESVKKLQNYNYDGIEWGVHDDYHIKLEEVEKKADYIRELTESHNLEIVTLISYVQVDDLENIKKLFNASKTMKCPQVRLLPPPYDRRDNYHQIYNRGLESAKRAEDSAKEYGIKMVFEIHPRTIIPSASLAYRWVRNFSPQNVGVVFDPGNMIEEGMENWKLGLEILGEYLAYVHCKNAGWISDTVKGRKVWRWEWFPINEGIVDWQEVIGILKEMGFDGYLSNEDFCDLPIDCKLKENKDYLRNLVEGKNNPT